jgi:hypothetical protein
MDAICGAEFVLKMDNERNKRTGAAEILDQRGDTIAKQFGMKSAEPRRVCLGPPVPSGPRGATLGGRREGKRLPHRRWQQPDHVT